MTIYQHHIDAIYALQECQYYETDYKTWYESFRVVLRKLIRNRPLWGRLRSVRMTDDKVWIFITI